MLSALRGVWRLDRERGQVVILFALLIPVLIGTGSIVIGIGNWYTHARHLQTKADAGALAGGGSWAFPCGPQIDARIEAQARTFVGPHTKADGAVYTGTPTFNAQIGGVGETQIHAVLNGGGWYDNDSNPPNAVDKVDPAGSICSALVLDVKLTEDDSFPLFSLIPFFPDIKRKARVEIQEAEGVTGLLPIAVRAPEPVSAAAVFYDEGSGALLGVKYFVKDPAISGLPSSLQGWSTFNNEDLDTWADFVPTARTGVVIATSFRGACDTNLPAGNTKITTTAAPCFEDEGNSTAAELCNQGTATQIVNCYSTTGAWPNVSVQSGLHFIRGYSTTNPGTGPPGLEDAYLEYLDCSYFNANPSTSCDAALHVSINLGTLNGEYPNPSPPPAQITEPLRSSDVEVRYCLVTPSSGANNPCNSQFSPDEELSPGSGTGSTVTFSTTGPTHPSFAAVSGRNAFAIQVRLRNAQNHTNVNCRNSSFNANCRYRYTATTETTNDLARDTILEHPVQRSMRGTSPLSGSTLWLRLTANDCAGGTTYQDNEAGSALSTSPSCFVVDMGLKGGIATDADGQPILFNDGSGSSQMGALDCDPTIPQGQELEDGVINGCNYWYARHPFDWDPLCPDQNNLFTLPNPGAPWNDGRWPPLRCVKTRPTGTMNQLEKGLKGRFFNNKNANSCPNDLNSFVKGRNYWKQGTNMATAYGYKDDSPARDTFFDPGDPRIVTIFLTTSEAFTGSGQNTYPVTGFIEVYITGFGKVSGNGSLNVDDPCPGSAPPTDADTSGSGYAVWGHVINYALPNPNATPSGVKCNPGASAQPCVAVLVE